MLGFLFCFSIHASLHAQGSFRKKQLIGRYARNTAQGWSRPSPGIEVVPEIPRYEYLDLYGNAKAATMVGSENAVKTIGKWKIQGDTLEISYRRRESASPIIRFQHKYLISMQDFPYGACLQPIATSQRANFCYTESEAFNSMRYRVAKVTNHYYNGNISAQGRFKKFVDDDHPRPYTSAVGKWRYYDVDGNLTKTVHYRRGEAIREALPKKKTPNNE